MLRPSTYPRSCIPRTNDSRYGSLFEVPARRYPTRGVFSGCSARAASGQAAAAPPSSDMNSRRFILDMGTSSPMRYQPPTDPWVAFPALQPATERLLGPWGRPELF